MDFDQITDELSKSQKRFLDIKQRVRALLGGLCQKGNQFRKGCGMSNTDPEILDQIINTTITLSTPNATFSIPLEIKTAYVENKMDMRGLVEDAELAILQHVKGFLAKNYFDPESSEEIAIPKFVLNSMMSRASVPRVV